MFQPLPSPNRNLNPKPDPSLTLKADLHINKAFGIDYFVPEEESEKYEPSHPVPI